MWCKILKPDWLVRWRSWISSVGRPPSSKVWFSALCPANRLNPPTGCISGPFAHLLVLGWISMTLKNGVYPGFQDEKPTDLSSVFISPSDQKVYISMRATEGNDCSCSLQTTKAKNSWTLKWGFKYILKELCMHISDETGTRRIAEYAPESL